MRCLILLLFGLLFLPLCLPLEAQTAEERLIVNAIGSSKAIHIATQHMDASATAARNISSDLAVPGPGMLDVDPLSRVGEWYVNYETRDREACRAAAATAVAAILQSYASGEWLVSTSCRISMVELTLDLDAGTARGRQWDSPDGYLWRNRWQLRP